MSPGTIDVKFVVRGVWRIRLYLLCVRLIGVPPPKLISQGEAQQRIRLPDRRRAVRDIVLHRDSHGNDRPYDISFGLDDANAVREVFCTPRHIKTGADLEGLMHDACIAISIALQRGARIADLAKSFSELRAEGQTSGPPASPLGAIARAGASLEIEIAEGWA